LGGTAGCISPQEPGSGQGVGEASPAQGVPAADPSLGGGTEGMGGGTSAAESPGQVVEGVAALATSWLRNGSVHTGGASQDLRGNSYRIV
jgi:hypothetical protein